MDVKGGSHADGLLTVAVERLQHRAVFVGDADDDRLPAPGRVEQSQGPHMAADDVAHLGAEGKAPLGVLSGQQRVDETVHLEDAAQPAAQLEPACTVPVVEIKIVQQRPHRQRSLIRAEVEPPVDPEAHPGHVPAMLVGGHTAVLDVVVHLQHTGVLFVGLQDAPQAAVFCFRQDHRFPP